MRIAIRTLLVSLLAGLACGPSTPPHLDPMELSLLQLEYLERADRLPPLQLSEVTLPQVSRLGSYSPLVWKVKSTQAQGRALFRPVPVEDLDSWLYASLVGTLEEYGFDLTHWEERPPLKLRVEVVSLVLKSENGDRDRRSCSIALRFHLEENPTGLAIETFQARAERELSGSWMELEGDEPRWLPQSGGEDPITLAAQDATRRFLLESLSFWRDPRRWEGSALQFSDLEGSSTSPAPAAPASH